MNAIFVVGTGRSGTHFLVRLLAGFEHAHDPFGGRESEAILQDVAKAALHHRMPSEATERHYLDTIGASGPVLIDQHHPNLFFAHHWAERLDDPVFLYPLRPARQIVASMFRHKGVRSWYAYARRRFFALSDRLPYPNRFLGVDGYLEVETTPLHMLCTQRILAHHRICLEQKARLGDRVRIVTYDALVTDPEAEFARVFTETERARLGGFTLVETPNPASLDKYLDVLTVEQVAEIDAAEADLYAQVAALA